MAMPVFPTPIPVHAQGSVIALWCHAAYGTVVNILIPLTFPTCIGNGAI